MITLWATARFSGVDATTPFEAVNASIQDNVMNVVIPDAAVSVNKGLPYPLVAAVLPSGVSVTGSWPTAPTNYTNTVNRGDSTAPFNGLHYQGIARVTGGVAVGTLPGPTLALSRQATEAIAISRIIRPAVAGTSPVRSTGSNNIVTTSTVTVSIASSVVGNLILVDLFTDDATAAFSPPDGTWSAGTLRTITGGAVQRFWKFATDTTTLSWDFTVVPGGAPTNSTPPSVSGTAALGATLSVSAGVWTGSPTFTYQWQRDGVDISAATNSTYVVQNADAGHALRCVVTGTNSGGALAVTSSNSISIPAIPVLATTPAISPAGPYHTGDTVTCDGGTWSGSPTKTYQWYRGASPVTGETNATYTLVTSDEGANVFCRVTATNAGGSATADSNTIVPNVTAPITDASILLYYSGGTGNTDPAASIGGARGGTYPGGLDALFPEIAGSVAAGGGTFYRVIYFRNTHTISTAAGCKAYIEQQLSHTGLHVEFAVPVEAKNVTVPALASGTTAPSGVTFSTASDPTTGQDFGDLGPGDSRGLYVKLVVAPGTTTVTEDDYIIDIQGSAA